MSSTTFATLLGTAEAWTNPDVSFANLLTITGPTVATADADLLRHVAALSLDSPVMLAAVLANDPSCITILNLPRVFHQGLVPQAPLDNNVFAFVGTSPDDATPVHLRDDAMTPVLVDGHTDATVLRTELNTAANVTDGLRNIIPAGHVTAQAYTVCRVLVLPLEFAAAFQASVSYTITQFYDTFIAPNVADAAWVTTYEEMVQWWICAAMRAPAIVGPPAVPAGPALGLVTQLALTMPQQRALNGWARRSLTQAAARVPAYHAAPRGSSEQPPN